MITVVNFSHPLSDDAKRVIADGYGWGDAKFVDVRVHVDRAAPLVPQVDAIVDAAARAASPVSGGNKYDIDCVILPGLSDVAWLLAEHFEHANVIRMAQAPNVIPPKFMPVEIIHSRRRRAG